MKILFHQRMRLQPSGFTLIELMVVVAIMMLLMGGGIAAYIKLNNRQLLVNSGRDLQLLLRTAQKQARVGSKPTGCARLLSYSVESLSGQADRAYLSAQCSNNTYVLQTVYFASGVQSTSPFNVRFAVLYGGATGAGTLTLQRSTQTISHTVGVAGDISEGAIQ